ncbi:hypothetical protein PO124_25850 [Bacillus licheniformis]|nr:hypothetical protein [Bacillus licheniformis]
MMPKPIPMPEAMMQTVLFDWCGRTRSVAGVCSGALLYKGEMDAAHHHQQAEKRRDEAVFFKAYDELLRQLKRQGMQKKKARRCASLRRRLMNAFKAGT